MESRVESRARVPPAPDDGDDGDGEGTSARPMGRTYTLVIALEAVVIAALWLLGRFFG